MRIGPYKVSPTEVIDEIDDCNWSVWSCEIEKPDGTIIEGSIQGDGHSWANETLMDENGNEL
jgi:hypothetical protein